MSGTAGIDGTLTRISELRARFGAWAPPGASVRTADPTTTGATTGTTPGATPAATAAGALFADRLATAAAALDAPAPTVLTPATRKAPGQYGALTPPADLAGFGNGRIPTGNLASLGVGSHQLWAPAAGAFRQLTAAARAAGVTIGVNDSYRDLGAQERMAREKGLYSNGGLAAAPGTSNHGWGVALDLELDGRAQQWMRDNGARYGFVEDVAREPWHWTYRPGS